LEAVVFDRMILHLHREPLDRRIHAGTFGHGPALHHAVDLEPEIEMQMTRVMLLNDIRESPLSSGSSPLRLRGFREVALAPILGQLLRRSATRAFRRHGSHLCLGPSRLGRPMGSSAAAELIESTLAGILVWAPAEEPCPVTESACRNVIV